MYVRGCIHVWVLGTYMMHPYMSGHMCVCVHVCERACVWGDTMCAEQYVCVYLYVWHVLV